MARPRPIAVVRLRAKIETSVTSARTRSTRNVPTTESAPMARGSRAATTLRKMNSSRSSVIGRAISSARTRSCSMVVPTSAEDLGEAADADGGAVDRARGTARPAPRRGHGSDRRHRSIRATTSARLLSSLRSGGGEPSDQYDTTSSTPGSAASRSVRSRPDAATARVVDRAVVGGHEQHEVRGAGVELLGEHVLGPGELRPGVVEPAAREAGRDVAAERRRRRRRTRGPRRGRVVGGGSRSRRGERASVSSTSGRTTS